MKKLTLIDVGIIFAAILIIIPGCAGNGIKLDIKTEDKEIKFKTDYQVENGLRLVRTEGGEYDIELGSATTKDQDATMWAFMLQIMTMMQSMYTGIQPIPMVDPNAEN